VLSRSVPRELWDRPKRGFEVPVRQWYRTSRRAPIERAIDTVCAAFREWIDPELPHAILRDHVENGMNYSQKLFTLDMLHGWVRKYL
jgi:asparagine synthase (glutamine-hydrolysing)